MASTSEFLKWTCPTSIFGTVHYQFLGILRLEFKVDQPTLYSVVRLNGCTGWPGSTVLAGNLQVLTLTSQKMIMDCSKNGGGGIIPFKKFSRLFFGHRFT